MVLNDGSEESESKTDIGSGRKKSSSGTKSGSTQKQVKTIRFDDGIRFYIEKGNGIGSPMTMCIFADNGIINNRFVCTVDDYKKGKVVILVNQKPVKII